MAHPRHEEVRQWYAYRCGYCGVSEEDVGGELTVDHFRPVSQGGDDSDTNLVYACSRCNLYKSDFWPDAQRLAIRQRLLHPRQDTLAEHLREQEEGTLEGLTETGRFHIAVLELNRPPLIAHRLRKRANQRQVAQNRLFRTVMEMQQTALLRMADYIAHLHERLDIPPHDEE